VKFHESHSVPLGPASLHQVVNSFA